jgi:2-iminobutanoate/2-iminopropanoate deaminase
VNWEMKKYPIYYGGVKQRYSRSAVVGNLIFCSSMDGATLETGKVPSDDVAEQTVVALDKVKGSMGEAGGAMDNVVQTVILLKDFKDYDRMREAELKYYEKHAPLLVDEPPASKVIQARSLVRPESLIEIEATGVISRDKPGWEVKKYPMYYGGVKQRYSRSAVVGNLIFCSSVDGAASETGKVPSDDVADQMVVALDKVKGSLREAGATMDNIIDTVMLLKDLKFYKRMREAELNYYFKHATLLVDEPPTSTFIQPDSLAKPECVVGVDVTAVVSKDEPGWKMRKYHLISRGKKIVYTYQPPGLPHLCKSVVVGNLLIGSGAVARTPETGEIFTQDVGQQTFVILDNVKDMLEEAGSSMDNLVKTFILIKDIKDYPRMREAELDYYQKHGPRLVEEPPVSTVIQPRGLASPDYLMEIAVISVISR